MGQCIDWRSNLFVVWVSQFISMLSFSAAYTFMPFYLEEMGVVRADLGLYVALTAAAGNVAFGL